MFICKLLAAGQHSIRIGTWINRCQTRGNPVAVHFHWHFLSAVVLTYTLTEHCVAPTVLVLANWGIPASLPEVHIQQYSCQGLAKSAATALHSSLL